jgi:hypothetical protein
MDAAHQTQTHQDCSTRQVMIRLWVFSALLRPRQKLVLPAPTAGSKGNCRENVMRGDASPNEERLRSGRRYRTDRTEGISDGVFAVSLTLLIPDVRPPEGGGVEAQRLAMRD